MPNGRSGGFIIRKADLRELMISVVPDSAILGKIFDHSPRSRPVNVSEATRFVEQCPHNRVAVEEQDHTAYIIHLSNEQPNFVWIAIGPESPIFPEIVQRHIQWNNEHPDWNGWM